MPTYEDFLKDSASTRIVTLEVTPLNIESGETETLYFSLGKFSTGPDDTPPNQPFLDRLTEFPEFETHLFSANALGGSSRGSEAEIDLSNLDGVLDGYGPRAYSWDGREVIIRDGFVGLDYADFRVVFTGTAKDGQLSRDALTLRLRDNQYKLDQPVSMTRYRGLAIGADADGIGDKVILPAAVIDLSAGNINSWTIEFWARMRGAVQSGRACLFSFNHSGTATETNHFAFFIGGSTRIGGATVNGEAELAFDNGGSADTSLLEDEFRRSYRDSLWHHWAIVSLGHLYKVYLDGQLALELEVDDDEPAFDRGTLFAYNKNNGTYQWYYKGELSDVRIWQRALTQEQIAEGMNSLLAGDESGLVANYRLDEGINLSLGLTEVPDYYVATGNETAAIAIDYSANQRHAIYAVTGAGNWRQTGEGLGSLAGKRKLIAIGESVFNIEPDAIDDRSLVWGVGHPVQSFSPVRDGGLPLASQPQLFLDGATAEVSIPDNAAYDVANADNFAIEICFEAEDPGGDVFQRLVHTESGNRRWQLNITPDGVLSFSLKDSGAVELSGDALQVVQPLVPHWVTLFYDADSKTATLLLDGEVQASKFSASFTGDLNCAASIFLGSDGVDERFRGKLREFRLWKGSSITIERLRLLMYAILDFDEAGLIGYWDFSDGTGTTLTDRTATGNDGTITDPSWQVAQATTHPQDGFFALRTIPRKSLRCDVQGWLPLGWSPVFDGTPTLSGGSVSDYPEADVDADDNLTVECWYRIDADPSGLGAAVLVSKQDLLTTAGWSLIIGPASNVIGLYLHDGALLGGDTPLDAHYDVRLEYPPGQWHYIAAVFDRTNDVINFYTERGFLATVAAGSPGDCSNSEDFRIGFHGTLGNEHFGSIMRVALHKRVVSEQELMENCRKPIFLTVDNDTAGCWPLNEGSGSTAYDLSYLGKHLTLQGHTWAEGPQPTTPADVIPWLLGQKTVILPSEIDWDSIDELAILKPGAVDLLIRDETVEKTFDLILAPGGWYSWDADGLIRFGRLIGPEVNRVIQFNEAPSHVVIPDDDTLDFDPAAHTGLSIEMRIRRPSGLVADTILLSKFQALANTGNYLLFISGFGIPNQVVVFTITYDSGNRYTYRTSASAPTDEEFMLSISYNQLSGLCDIYFNGELQSQLTRLDNATTPDLTDDLLLGAADTSGTFPFPGWMNEVRLFRRSITEDEVLANLHTQLRGDEPDLVGYWRCDELDGDTLIDSSENGNDGTVTNVSRLTVQSIDNYFTRGVYLTLADNRDLALSDPLTEANAIYMLKSLNPLPVDVPALRQVVKYRHNWDHQRQEDLLALVNTIPTLSSLLKQEWRSVDGGGAESVRRNHLLPSPDEETESAIRELFYARIEAVRQAQLFSLERQRFEVVAPPIAQAVLVGDEIRIKSTRFGIGEKGRNFIVMRKKVLSNRMVELEVFG